MRIRFGEACKLLKTPHVAQRNVGHRMVKQTELRRCDRHFSFLISHFSFYIFHFIFLISHFRFPRVSAFRQTPPSTRLGNRGQSCLSTDRRAPTSRTSLPRSRAGCTRPRTVGLSNCRVSDAKHLKALNLKSYQASSLCLNIRKEEAFLLPPLRPTAQPFLQYRYCRLQIYSYLRAVYYTI